MNRKSLRLKLLCRLTQAVPLLDDPVVLKIAKKYKKTAGQILLRFVTQLGVAVIPKSSNPTRLAENFSVNYLTVSPQVLSLESYK